MELLTTEDTETPFGRHGKRSRKSLRAKRPLFSRNSIRRVDSAHDKADEWREAILSNHLSVPREAGFRAFRGQSPRRISPRNTLKRPSGGTESGLENTLRAKRPQSSHNSNRRVDSANDQVDGLREAILSNHLSVPRRAGFRAFRGQSPRRDSDDNATDADLRISTEVHQ